MLRGVLVLALTFTAYAQEFRATLSGRVIDPSGAGVVDAKVEVRSTTTGTVLSTVSGADGAYQIPFINPGEYTVTTEKAGFRRSVQEGVRLQLAERAVLNISLALGEVAQSVTVSANTALVETESADRSLVIEGNRVQNTPLQGRNIFAQAWSAPGIAVTASVQRLRPFDIAGSSSMSISGGRPSGNEVLIDGVSNLARAGQVAYVPPVEATGEFRVQTTSYDAQYGWTTGGVVNIVTKGGSNAFHGSAFEFLQNTILNANTFNANRTGTARTDSHINTFGGDISGPIKKDKLFFLFSYENIRQIIPDPFVTSVPSELQRNGDFSQTFYTADAQGNRLLQTVYDPFSTRDEGGTLVRTPFPGNRIPTNRLNPIARNVLGLIPQGNVAGNAITGFNNLVSTPSTRKFTDFFPEYSGRVDYNISDRSRFFVRYSRNALAEERGFRYSTRDTLNVAETSGNTPFKRENHSATMQYTRTLSATSVLDFRVGLARFLAQSGNSIGQGYNLASLGFAPQFVGQAVPYFPRFNFSNYESAGSTPVQNDPISQTNSAQVGYAKTLGRQNLKYGGEFRLQRAYIRVPGFVAGFYNFTQLFTGSNPLRVEPGSGNAIASFLMGTPNDGGIDVNSQAARQQRLYSLYFQDDIRVTQKLKLNLGIRWDYLGPMTDRFNGLSRGFDFQAASPLQVSGLNVRGGILFAGASGQDRGIFDKDLNNFGPRFGMAYSLNSKTVLRGGYGLIYAQTFDDPGNAPGYSQRTPMVTSIRTGVPENLVTNPFPAGVQQPVGNSLGLATFLGQGFNFPDPTRATPWTHQFSFEIQRELPFNFLVSAAYVGSRLRGLAVNKPINEISRESYALGASALTANVPNPFVGRLPGTALNGATVQRQQLLRPFPQFQGLTQLFRSEGEQRYDGLQAMVYKRISGGLNFSAAYTFSKIIERRSYANAQDTQLEKVIGEFDMPHNLQLNGIYELPLGKNKAFLANAPGIVNRIVGGWEVSAIARIQTGFPMNFPANAVPTGRDPRYDGQSRDRWFNTCTQLPNGNRNNCLAGEEPVWTVRQAFTLQTWSSRLASVRRPPVRNLDVSVLKHNQITERVDLVFRTDFLNATNTPQFFNGPITDVNNGNFGRMAGAMDQSNLPRFIQLSLKLVF